MMQALDLQEFAELRYRAGEPFGREILELLELLDQKPLVDACLEMSAQLVKATGQKFKEGEEWRHVEWLEGHVEWLEEIDTTLKAAGFKTGDMDDRVTEVLAKLEEAETELAALRKELEEAETELAALRKELEEPKSPAMEYDL